MDGGSSDWWIYLSVNNHVTPSIAIVPRDTVVVVVVVVVAVVVVVIAVVVVVKVVVVVVVVVLSRLLLCEGVSFN